MQLTEIEVVVTEREVVAVRNFVAFTATAMLCFVMDCSELLSGYLVHIAATPFALQSLCFAVFELSESRAHEFGDLIAFGALC